MKWRRIMLPTGMVILVISILVTWALWTKGATDLAEAKRIHAGLHLMREAIILDYAAAIRALGCGTEAFQVDTIEHGYAIRDARRLLHTCIQRQKEKP